MWAVVPCPSTERLYSSNTWSDHCWRESWLSGESRLGCVSAGRGVREKPLITVWRGLSVLGVWGRRSMSYPRFSNSLSSLTPILSSPPTSQGNRKSSCSSIRLTCRSVSRHLFRRFSLSGRTTVKYSDDRHNLSSALSSTSLLPW